MTTKQQIRAEIERMHQQSVIAAVGNETDWLRSRIGTLVDIMDFLDTLPDESEQPTRGYDEAYLNEKIVKASKSWEGVDVDKFMDEVRGREKTVTDCHDLEEEMEKYIETFGWGKTKHLAEKELISATARHFAEWGAEHLAGVRKMISDDLEEAAMNYIAPIENEDGLKVINFSGQDVADAFEAGAEWQKKQFEKKES